jgi:hypothetical protein
MSPLSKKIVKLKAELMSGSHRYPGFVESFSKDDVFISASPAMQEDDSSPGKTFNLKFTSPCGKKVNLTCRVKWSYKTPPYGYTNSIGLEILNQHTPYKDIINVL